MLRKSKKPKAINPRTKLSGIRKRSRPIPKLPNELPGLRTKKTRPTPKLPNELSGLRTKKTKPTRKLLGPADIAKVIRRR